MVDAKYYVRKSVEDEWEDIATKFVGVKVLTLNGLNERGDTVNVYSEQWVNSQSEDFLVATQDGQGHDVVIRKNVDLSLTFICGTRYGASNTQAIHDTFVDYITQCGDFYIKSNYMEKEAHVICLKAYKPTTQKLQRGLLNSYIMGTIDLHTLTMPTKPEDVVYDYDLYIGMGDASISSQSEIMALTNVQHIEANDINGNYSIVIPSTSYLWICTNATVESVMSSGFEVPMQDATIVGDYRCYRSSNDIKAHTMQFTLTAN